MCIRKKGRTKDSCFGQRENGQTCRKTRERRCVRTDGQIKKAGEKITCPFQMSPKSAAEEAAAVVCASAAAENENEPD